MSDAINEQFAKPRLVDMPNVPPSGDIPRWLERAMELYADHNLPNDEFDLRGQYTENRMFLRRIENDVKEGKLSATDLRDMEEGFAKACADPEGDPMIAIEQIYLDKYYARQPKRRAAPAVGMSVQQQPL